MRLLFVSDFAADPHSGAAGTLLAIGAALERAGHVVDYDWKDERPYRLRHATAARLLELAGRQRRQVEQRLRSAAYDVVSISQPYAYPVFERVAPRYPRTVFLNRTHGWEARLYEAQRRFGWGSGAPRLPSRVSEALTRRACRRAAGSAHGVVTGSRLCAAWIRNAYGLTEEHVAAIPYGLDTDALSRTTAPRRPGFPGVLYVGNYLPLKGARVMEVLLPELGRRLPELRLTFVVDRAAAERVTDRYGPAFGSRLTVHSWLAREDLWDVYGTHDILLYPSLFEGFGKVWLEAMAFGLCVVGFAEGGLPDVALADQHARYCSPGDVSGLRELLAAAVQEPEHTHAIGARAAQRARQYTWDRAAAEMLRFCDRVAAHRWTPRGRGDG